MTKVKKGGKAVARLQQRQKLLKAGEAGVLEVAMKDGKTVIVKVKKPTVPGLGKASGKTVYAGHKVRGVMADGTPILEAVAKPSNFTKKQIGDTIRDIMTERMAEAPLRYAS